MRIDPNRAPDDQKLQELILFIALRSSNDERFGSIKLNKLLFFSDFLAYAKLGRSITGHGYQRLPNGPAPKKMLPVLRQMSENNSLCMAERDYYGRSQKIPIALREPHLDSFSAEEIAIVTDVIEGLKRKNAKGISSLSHKFPGWKLAREGEIIPYEVALAIFAKPRQQDIKNTLSMKEELAALRREADFSDAD